MAELLLDSDIRTWVFLPIVIITFLVGMIRYYISIILAPQNVMELQHIQDTQVVIRARILREHGKYIQFQSFHMRRHYFNSEGEGYLKTMQQAKVFQRLITSPSFITDMLKGYATNVQTMIFIGGWINWTFSGFVTSKIPFPLTSQFKSMLQRGIELQSLDASWVSSASWYFLNVFGLRGVYSVLLNESADVTPVFQNHITAEALSVSADVKANFKTEWEALKICEHYWVLKDVEKNIILQSISTIYV